MKKRICLWFAIIMMLTVCFIPTSAAEKEDVQTKSPAVGDVDANGTITAADAALILRYIVKLETLSGDQEFCAECNNDGNITAADATVIMRYVVHLDTIPPSAVTVTLPPYVPTSTPTATPTPTNPTGLDGVIAEAKINANELNLRTGAGTSYPVVTLMKRDTKVYVFSNSGDWWYIQIKDTQLKGWALAKYIETTNDPLVAYGKAAVNATMYKEASLTSTVLTTVVFDTNVGIIGRKDTFYKIRLLDTGVEGFVLSSAFPTLTSLSAGPSPVPTPSPTPTPNGQSGVTAQGVINAASVHLRSDAGTEHSIVKTMAKDTPVYVFEKKAATNAATLWYHVQIKGEATTGWVLVDYVTLSNARISQYATVAAQVYLRVRSTTTSDKVSETPLAVGTEIGIIGSVVNSGDDLWYHVRVLSNGLEGWIRGTTVTLGAVVS